MTLIRNDQQGRDDGGFTLIELIAALSILAVAAIAVSMSMLHGAQHQAQSFRQYTAMSALRSRIAEIQDTANEDQNVINYKGVGAVYLKYDGAQYTVPGLTSSSLAVQCFANEATLPAALGGPQDLNFDGDADDDLGNVSVGTDLKLVPMTLTLSFTDGGIPYTMTVHRLITRTAG